MLLEGLNRMFKKILLRILNCEKKRDRKIREIDEGGSTQFVSGVDPSSIEKKIPDPWYE